MISYQCDELRKAADELQGFEGNIHNFTLSEFYSTSRHTQQVLRSAADTIWELRNKLAGTVDQSEEIERLKRENAELKKAMDFQALELGCMTDNRDVLHVENKNLRELVAWMYRLMDESCAIQHPFAPEPIRYDTLLDVHKRLRELGVSE